jgi:hypothetical protein
VEMGMRNMGRGVSSTSPRTCSMKCIWETKGEREKGYGHERVDAHAAWHGISCMCGGVWIYGAALFASLKKLDWKVMFADSLCEKNIVPLL